MKTIVVLTDPYLSSENTARYAIHLAQKIKSNVLLAEAVFDYSKIAALQAEDIEYASETTPGNHQLTNLCNKLELEMAQSNYPGKYVPSIYCDEQVLPVEEMVPWLQSSLDVAYVIVSANLYYSSSALMAGHDYAQVLAHLKVPLIIIPEDQPLRYPEKYAFIGDVQHDYSGYLNTIAALADYSAATIMLTNINTGRPLDNDQELAVRSIMKETINKVNYGRIYYHHIPNQVTKTDVEWLFHNNKFEALVTVYHKNDIYNNVLEFGFNQKIKGNITVPFIIFPGLE